MPLIFGSKEANEQLARDTGKRLSGPSVWTADALAAMALEDDWEECDVCQGKGGHWECASLPHDDDAAGAV